MLVDSSADENFIDSDFVNSHSIPTYELSTPNKVQSVDGKILALVTCKMEPLRLMLYVITTPLNSIILGIPWLKLHNHQLDWSTATIHN